MPRRVHTNFQGLLVVFTLLSYIARGRLTEHCCSHLFWLCDTARSGLCTPTRTFTVFPEAPYSFVCHWVSPFDIIIILYYGINVNTFLKKNRKNFYLNKWSVCKTARGDRPRAAQKERSLCRLLHKITYFSNH